MAGRTAYSLAWRLRLSSMTIMWLGSLVLADGLRSQPNVSQAGIPWAGLFPWLWAAVAGLWSTAIVADLREWLRPRYRPLWGFRPSTLWGLLAIALTFALAVARGIAWAIDFGIWDSRSVWGVWTVVAGMSLSQLSLAWRVIHDRQL